MRRPTFDLDVLRGFVLGVELGSFARAAERLGRSTSAISAQLKKLEQQAQGPLLHKAGRGLALTDAGEIMLGYARRLLALNDEAAAAVHGIELAGWIRLGVQEDFGEALLPQVLGPFARAHPKVRIEARVARNAELMERLAAGQLDLALAWDTGHSAVPAEMLAQLPLGWIAAADATLTWRQPDQPLPLVAFEQPCLMRSAATLALDRAGIAWRLAFTSPSLSGLWAATAAGLGITVRTPAGLPSHLKMLDPAQVQLPTLPSLGLRLHYAEVSPTAAVLRLAALIKQHLAMLTGQRALATPAMDMAD
jgi:DNA-binding transcriptional LysR family regulator